MVQPNTEETDQFYLGDVSIKKSSANIHQTFDPAKKVTALQAKILNAVQYKLQSMAQQQNLNPNQFRKNHPGVLTISMSSQEFRHLIGYESRNNTYIRKIMNEIRAMSVMEDTLEQGSAKGRIYFRNLFISAEYTDATFKFEIPEKTTELLISDATSAIIDVLTIANSVGSKYTIFLNDLIEEWSYKESKEEFVILIDDEDLKNLMKIPFEMEGKNKIYSYKAPSILIRKVIEPAVKELNTSNLRFEVKDYKSSKRLGKITWRFEVASKKTMVLHKFAEKHAHEIAEIRSRIKLLGMSEDGIFSIISKIASEYDISYANYNVDIVKEMVRNGKAKNPAGLLLRCMENNKEAFDQIWESVRQKNQEEKAKKKAKYEESIKNEREKRFLELAELKTTNHIDMLKTRPEASNDYADEFIKYLSNIPLPAAKELEVEVTVNRFKREFINDPMYYKFILERTKKNLTTEEIDTYIRAKGTAIEF